MPTRSLIRRSAVTSAAALLASGLAGIPAGSAAAQQTAPGACGDPATPAYEVQGPGAETPIPGQRVEVEAVVVGDVQAGLAGFYVQDAIGDGDPATSDGLFVFAPGAVDVQLGDLVRVSGVAEEFFGQTQLDEVTSLQVCASGAGRPAPVALTFPVAEVTDLEAYEGMRVTVEQELTVTEVFNLYRFGEVDLSVGGRLITPTEVAEPGAAAQEVAAQNDRRRIILDDASNARYEDVGAVPPYLTPTDPVRVGDTVETLEDVVLGFGFGNYRLQPADGTADGSTFAATNLRPARPADVGGDVRLAAFNVLNYFVTLDHPESRGASTPEELAQQQAKIVEAIDRLGADVVALQEIENSAVLGAEPDLAVRTLVNALNQDAGARVWAHVPSPANLPPVEDQDVITNAIIYRLDTVYLVGPSVALVDESVWFNAREPIAQTFSASGDTFTVVSNHFKSKSPTDATGDNVDAGDGQGAYNGDRVRQAESLAAFVGDLEDSTGDADVLLLGDFNAYSQEDPIDVLRNAGLVDLAPQFAPGEYSYVFGGESGSLDHALATAELTEKVTGVDVWDINAVESHAYEYDGAEALYLPNQYRSSDHEPIVVGLDVAPTCYGLIPTIVGTSDDDVLYGTSGPDVIHGLGGSDVIHGLRGDDVICGGPGHDIVAGGIGGDVLLGGLGDDIVAGQNGADTLFGGDGDDVLDGGRGENVVEQDGRND